jgi:hypothetical protein
MPGHGAEQGDDIGAPKRRSMFSSMLFGRGGVPSSSRTSVGEPTFCNHSSPNPSHLRVPGPYTLNPKP